MSASRQRKTKTKTKKSEKGTADIVVGPASVRLGQQVIHEDWYNAPEGYLATVATAAGASTAVHPRKLLKKPPAGANPTYWRTTDIYLTHPLMCLLLQKECVTILGFSWNDILSALNLEDKTKATRAFVSHINDLCGTEHDWIPPVTTNAALPPRYAGNASMHDRFVPTFLMPFLRKLVSVNQLDDFDTQIDALMAHVMLTLRFEETATPHLQLVRGQLRANITKSRMAATWKLTKEVSDLTKHVRDLQSAVAQLQDNQAAFLLPPPPPPPDPDDVGEEEEDESESEPDTDTDTESDGGAAADPSTMAFLLAVRQADENRKRRALTKGARENKLAHKRARRG